MKIAQISTQHWVRPQNRRRTMLGYFHASLRDLPQSFIPFQTVEGLVGEGVHAQT